MAYDNLPENTGWLTYRVAQGILVEDGAVLLSGNRWYSNKPLVWTLPGGRAEEGEGTSEALVREFLEETGLTVEVGGLAFVAEARSAVARRFFSTCAFVVTRIDGQLTPGIESGVEDLRFVPIAELASYLPAPSLGRPLLHFLRHPQDTARYWFFPEYTVE